MKNGFLTFVYFIFCFVAKSQTIDSSNVYKPIVNKVQFYGYSFISINPTGVLSNKLFSNNASLNFGLGLGTAFTAYLNENYSLIVNAETSTLLIDRESTEEFYEGVVNYELEFEDVPNFSIIENSYAFGLLKTISSKSDKHYFSIGPQIGFTTFKKKVQGYTSNLSAGVKNSVVIQSIENHALLLRLNVLHKINVKKAYHSYFYKIFGSLNYSRKNYNELVQQNFFSSPNETVVIKRKLNYLSLTFGVGFSMF